MTAGLLPLDLDAGLSARAVQASDLKSTWCVGRLGNHRGRAARKLIQVELSNPPAHGNRHVDELGYRRTACD